MPLLMKWLQNNCFREGDNEISPGSDVFRITEKEALCPFKMQLSY